MSYSNSSIIVSTEAYSGKVIIRDILDLSEMDDLLKSNEKIFDMDGITYRVRKPNNKEKREVYQKRIEKYTELLNNEKYSLEEDLKKSYKRRGIDIDAMILE
jgi:hypothetical protein